MKTSTKETKRVLAKPLSPQVVWRYVWGFPLWKVILACFHCNSWQYWCTIGKSLHLSREKDGKAGLMAGKWGITDIKTEETVWSVVLPPWMYLISSDLRSWSWSSLASLANEKMSYGKLLFHRISKPLWMCVCSIEITLYRILSSFYIGFQIKTQWEVCDILQTFKTVQAIATVLCLPIIFNVKTLLLKAQQTLVKQYGE